MGLVNELETEGWHFKVGDVYSNPSSESHFKITKIEYDTKDIPEDALIYGERVHPDDHNYKVYDSDVFDDFGQDGEWHRAWHFNESWDLETI